MSSSNEQRPQNTEAFNQVFDAEIKTEIKTRRTEAGLDPSQAEANLIGLSLSGGGVRSGAIGLGIFQGLNRSGLLRFVDYLSTVSGGGYAGAYLSSVSLQPEAKEEAKERRLPISPDASLRQSSRILKFLDAGKQLNRPLVFANRYLIGLLLTWVVIFSGLIVVASGAAWLFRLVYKREVQDYLSITGFRDDFGFCLLPPLAVFLLWGLAWVGAWVCNGAQRSRSLGHLARWLFVLLLVTSGVSFAALVGAGDIDSSDWLPQTRGTPNQRVNQLMTTAQTLVLSGILAALIPYLNPLRLFRSGATSQSTAEKYIYAISSRALVFGVPFLIMSYFVQEDISDYYAHRDGLLEGAEIRNGETLAPQPVVSSVAGPVLPTYSFLVKSSPAPTLWYQADDLSYDAAEAAKNFQIVQQFLNGDTSTLPPLKDFSIYTLFETSRICNAVTSQFHTVYTEHTGEYDDNRLSQNAEAAPWTRGGYALDYLTTPLRPDTARVQSAIGGFVAAQKLQRAVEANRNRRVNEKLLDRDFAEKFLPSHLFIPPSPSKAMPVENTASHLKFEDDKARTKWALDLRDLRNEAIRVGDVDATERATLHKDSVEHQSKRAVSIANRKVLEHYYGDAIVPQTTVLSTVAWQHDQLTRKHWFFGSLAVFILSSLLVDLNATSCHGFYAKQIAENWIEEAPGVGRDIPLAQLSTASTLPYHLICGCVRLVGRRRERSTIRQRSPFLFSKLFCGSERLAFVKTTDFMGGDYTLADAIAASGGALSPTESTNPLAGFLLTLTNLRLGQWVENPAYRPVFPRLWASLRQYPFVPFRWMIGMARKAEERPFCLVTDGGYYENLGVEALLRRRCKLIIAVDAGQDECHRFEDFVRLVRRVRLEHGIRLTPLDAKFEREMLECISLSGNSHASPAGSEKAQPSLPSSWTAEHFTAMKIMYPPTQHEPERTGVMIYVKSSITGDEPLEIVYHQMRNKDFPHDKTGDQLFDADQFLSYVQLGSHMAEKLSAKLSNLSLDQASVDAISECFLPQNAAGSEQMASGRRNLSPSELHWTSDLFRDAIKAGDAQEIAALVAMRLEIDPEYIKSRISDELKRSKGQPSAKRATQLRDVVARAIAEQN